mmetsp:Transcript_28259/g.91396  ORF Transcript_28259/g.91396 Transcript_28259/m.91396 type:complete len:228 (+) Transcript_28259:503-1186(+)
MACVCAVWVFDSVGGGWVGSRADGEHQQPGRRGHVHGVRVLHGQHRGGEPERVVDIRGERSSGGSGDDSVGASDAWCGLLWCAVCAERITVERGRGGLAFVGVVVCGVAGHWRERGERGQPGRCGGGGSERRARSGVHGAGDGQLGSGGTCGGAVLAGRASAGVSGALRGRAGCGGGVWSRRVQSGQRGCRGDVGERDGQQLGVVGVSVGGVWPDAERSQRSDGAAE